MSSYTQARTGAEFDDAGRDEDETAYDDDAAVTTDGFGHDTDPPDAFADSDDVMIDDDDDDAYADTAAVRPDAGAGTERPAEVAEPMAAEADLPVAAVEEPVGSRQAVTAGTRPFDERWELAQILFVDDPRAAVASARELADEAVDAVVASLRARQRALAGSEGESADTDALLTAMRSYRDFFGQLPTAEAA